MKKLSLDNLKVKSFVTNLEGRTEMAGAERKVICGVTLCPPCTQDPIKCALSLESMCMTCVDTPIDIEPIDRG